MAQFDYKKEYDNYMKEQYGRKYKSLYKKAFLSKKLLKVLLVIVLMIGSFYAGCKMPRGLNFQTIKFAIQQQSKINEVKHAATSDNSSHEVAIANDIAEVTAGDWFVGKDFAPGRYCITSKDICAYVRTDGESDVSSLLTNGDGGYTCTLVDGEKFHCSGTVILTPVE